MKTVIQFFVISVLLIGSSCKKEETPTDPPVTSANMSGEVNLYDEGTTELDNDGMTVSIENTSPAVSMTTDSDGKYRFENLAFGTYTLVYSKTGYGTFKKFDIEHKNTGMPTFISPNPSLGQLSTTTITNLTVDTTSTTVTLGATMNPAANVGNTRYIRYFFSKKANVSDKNFEAVLETFPAQISPYNLNLTTLSLEALGFTSGETVYAKCYGESFWSNQYEDPDLGRTVFPNVNPVSAPAVSFIVP